MNICFLITILSLFWQIPGDNPTGFEILLRVIVAAAVIAALILPKFYFSFQRAKKRVWALQTFAGQNGWTFTAKSSVKSFPDFDEYRLFRHEKNKVSNLLLRNYDGGQVMIFDYAYKPDNSQKFGNDTPRSEFRQTIIAFYNPQLRLPYFELHPKPEYFFGVKNFFRNRFLEVETRKNTDFASHPEFTANIAKLSERLSQFEIEFMLRPLFSKLFLLRGNDESQIRTNFHAQVLDYFEKKPKISVTAGGSYLFVYTKNQTISTGNLNAFIKTGLDIYGLFRN